MMVKPDDWRAAYLEVVERGRERHPDPPTAEELLAWSRGELPESEAERMRELLALYPDLAVSLSEDDEEGDDEAPLLSRTDLAADWELLLQRVAAQPVSPHVAAARVDRQSVARWRWSTIVPVAAALLCGALLLQSRFTVSSLRKQLEEPRQHVERVVLMENTVRGAPSAAVPLSLQPATRYVVVALTVDDEIRDDELQAEIRNLDDPSSSAAWRGTVSRGSDGTFSIEVPRSFFASRNYGVSLYRNGETQPVATYAFWLIR